jgi:hypothetical protein
MDLAYDVGKFDTCSRKSQSMCIFSILLPAGKIRLVAGAVLLKLFLASFWGSQTNEIAYTHAIQCFMLLFRWIDFNMIRDPKCDFCLSVCLFGWLVDDAGKKNDTRSKFGGGNEPSG